MRAFFLTIFMVFICAPVLAQDLVAVDPLMPPALAPVDNSAAEDSYDDVPSEFIREAVRYGEECMNSENMPKFYDCRCMAVTYLDRRVALGKEASPSTVALGVGPKCADGTGIAGDLYEKCTRNYYTIPVHIDVEDYCTCYASNFAKSYEALPKIMNSNDKVRLMTRAKLACRNP